MATILVVDDDSFFLTTLCDNLESEGFTCECATNVEEALDLLSTHDVDLVLTDNEMPVRNGLDLIEDIKKRPNLHHLPIILLTGNLDPEITVLAERMGALTTMTKPFDFDDLKQVIVSAVENTMPVKRMAKG